MPSTFCCIKFYLVLLANNTVAYYQDSHFPSIFFLFISFDPLRRFLFYFIFYFRCTLQGCFSGSLSLSPYLIPRRLFIHSALICTSFQQIVFFSVQLQPQTKHCKSQLPLKSFKSYRKIRNEEFYSVFFWVLFFRILLCLDFNDRKLFFFFSSFCFCLWY